MKRVVVTGAKGFLGKNLCAALRRMKDVSVYEHDRDDSESALHAALLDADAVFHLAGVNRPERVEEFESGNAGSTEAVLRVLRDAGRAPLFVLSSSIQADRDNPYGRSKRAAEELLRRHCEATGAPGVVHRLRNLFGKWSRPNYNTVVATFCHNIARDLPIQISDPGVVVDLSYVDDVVEAFLSELAAAPPHAFRHAPAIRSTAVTLGELATLIRSFRGQRQTLLLPDLSQPFVRALYATYLSFLPPDQSAYGLEVKVDARGSLAEFIKSPWVGQLFVSRTKPGVVRGNHFHDTKTEKFLVVQGEAVIRMRQIHGSDVIEFGVRGEDYRVVDMLPGYTHHIENVGQGELITLFWASEIFDPTRPDTYFDPVNEA